MTSVLKEDDKIFTMYKQYKELLSEGVNFKVNGLEHIAAQLTVAHMLDHVVCLLKKDNLPTARKVNDMWRETFGEEELEIMQNNAKFVSPLQEYSAT